MRRFLYVTPYFPPQTRVGALRPLKFARHLPGFGWSPVVLADLRPSDTTDPRHCEALPDAITVRHDYSRHAAKAYAAFASRRRRQGADDNPPASGRFARELRRFDAYASRRPWYPRPEWLPLGAHSLDLPHAAKAARRLLQEHSECEAILVNADPYAALLLGRSLARETGLPLIADLRDPWGPCALRRPLRPAPMRALEDRLERSVIEAAAAYVLNTQSALRDYHAHYANVDPGRFFCIRNHSDAGLIGHGQFAPRPVFTLLLLGNLRRFIEGDVIIETLAELMRRGHSPGRLRLLVSGEVTREARQLAVRLGVEGSLETRPPVAYAEVGALMRSADVLIALSHASDQRIPAKIYDYLTSERPVLVYTDNSELRGLIRGMAAVTTVGLRDAAAAADAIEGELARGRRRSVERAASGLDSRTASGELAAILDHVTRARPG